MMERGNATVRRIAYAIFLVALAGLFDAAYLTVEHYRGVIPPCSGVSNCEAVLTSQYAELFGIPIALFGALYYIAAAALAFAIFSYGYARANLLLKLLVGSAFLVSVGLVGIQHFILEAYCLYCLVSASITTVLAILTAVMHKREGLPEHPQS